MNYQLWLLPEQKNQLLEYIKDRRYKLMITMYCSLIMSLLLFPLAVWDFKTLDTPVHYLGGQRIVNGSWLLLWIISFLLSIVYFVRGIGKDFWKNSDYDCLKHDAYTLDIRECSGKLPDSGKYPYFITDSDGNAYQCCMKFLEWKNLPAGEELLCVTLRNGQKFALLQA